MCFLSRLLEEKESFLFSAQSLNFTAAFPRKENIELFYGTRKVKKHRSTENFSQLFQVASLSPDSSL